MKLEQHKGHETTDLWDEIIYFTWKDLPVLQRCLCSSPVLHLFTRYNVSQWHLKVIPGVSVVTSIFLFFMFLVKNYCKVKEKDNGGVFFKLFSKWACHLLSQSHAYLKSKVHVTELRKWPSGNVECSKCCKVWMSAVAILLSSYSVYKWDWEKLTYCYWWIGQKSRSEDKGTNMEGLWRAPKFYWN